MTNESDNIIIRENEEDGNDSGENFPPIEHKASVTVLDAIGNRKTSRISYTLLLTDELNLKRPIGIELYVESDGSIDCEVVEPEDIQRDYHIEIKIPSQVL